ncbi:MAG: ABC transporter substrate-binding protein [candidate division NC10 bacterium]|nr:ABC transporter substrate-binding protein [candidate division NC10 bacterium]
MAGGSVTRRQVLKAAVALAGVAAIGWPRRGTAAPEKVRMACWSQPISEQANVYAAQEFGWFREQGLDFEFVPGAGGGEALKHVLAGNAEFAFTNVEPILFGVEQGAQVQVVYNIYPKNVFNVVSLKSRNIARPQDLKGKRIGVYSMASGTRHNLLVILHSVGLRESDVEVVATGVLNFGPLMEGRVDATAATDTGLWAAQQTGLGDVNVIWARDYLDIPTDVVAVRTETAQKRPDFVRRFLRAYRKGSQWMLDNPEKAAELAIKHAIDGQDVKRNLEIIKIRNASTVSEGTKKHGLGWFDMDVLRRVEKTYLELGLLKKRVDVESLFTNRFVQEL